ncbi:MAG: alpha/beta hydrolase [Verrucomicrobia bacterium]|nr:alpha/beta hydrolase [Verrucomicrobiota bacterium]
MEYIGPDLSAGPLPAVFYFALSAKDSLFTAPFNQPAQALLQYKLRVFSLTLPGHHLPPNDALPFWAAEVAAGRDPLADFLKTAADTISGLLDRHIIIPNAFGVMGLSRGAFIAAHVAALFPTVKAVLGFAPLTRLDYASEFQDLHNHPIVQKSSLDHLVPALYNRHIRLYIGNHDMRVGTDHSFAWMKKLADAAWDHRIRSSPIELLIGSSLGYQGHGTSEEVFTSGAEWLGKTLGASHA